MAGDFKNWRSQGPDANDLVNKGSIGSMLDMVNKWQAGRNNGAGGNIGAVAQAMGHQKDLKVKLAAIDAELEARKHDSLVNGAVALGKSEQEGINRVNELTAQGRQTRSTLKAHAAAMAANSDFKTFNVDTEKNTAGSSSIERFAPTEMAKAETIRNQNAVMPKTADEEYANKARDARFDRNSSLLEQTDKEAAERRSRNSEFGFERLQRQDAYDWARKLQADKDADELARTSRSSSEQAPMGNGPMHESYSAVHNDYNEPDHEDHDEEEHEESSPAPVSSASREPAPIPQAPTAAVSGPAFRHTKGAGSYEPAGNQVQCTWCGNYENTPEDIHAKHAIQPNGWCQHSLNVFNEVKNS
jgi:hypothetical protein